MDIKALEKTVSNFKEAQENLIDILHEIQKKYNHIPKEAVEFISLNWDIPKSHIFSVVTFYKAFTLKPRGRNLIRVCMGTACHLKGASSLVKTIYQELGIEPGQTTRDNNFTLEVVNCVGSCSMAPVIAINDKYYGQMTIQKMKKLLNHYNEGGTMDEI